MNIDNPLPPNATMEETAQYYHDEMWKLVGILAEKDKEINDLKAQIDDDDSPYPTLAELNEEDAKDLWRIVDWVRIHRPETRLAGENPTNWIIRVLEGDHQ